MSNLNSVFDTLRGWPNGSALEKSFPPDPRVSAIVEGKIVKTASLELPAAAVLKMVDDSLTTAPTLTAGDAGNAYHVAGNGGGWASFSVGDIVEWDGSAWNLILAGSGGTPVGPPDGTRVVVTDSGAAGSFAGHEEETMVFSTGAPGSWAVAETPVNGNRIYISGANSIYGGKYFDYTGTHPAGAWGLASTQTSAGVMVSLLSSSQLTGVKDDAWLVIQGNDQWDAQMAGVVTCLKLSSGCTFKIQHNNADSLVAGTLLEAVSGDLQAHTDKWPVGQVIYSNGVAGTKGYIVVASY